MVQWNDISDVDFTVIALWSKCYHFETQLNRVFNMETLYIIFLRVSAWVV